MSLSNNKPTTTVDLKRMENFNFIFEAYKLVSIVLLNIYFNIIYTFLLLGMTLEFE